MLPLINPHVRFIADGDGGVLLHLDTDRFFTVNSSGAFIWERLQAGFGPLQIVDQLASVSDGDAASVQEDVLGFLSELGQLGMYNDSEPGTIRNRSAEAR